VRVACSVRYRYTAGAVGALQRKAVRHIALWIRAGGMFCGSIASVASGFLGARGQVLEKTARLDEEEMVDILSSNLCRWVGCANKAVHAAAADMKARA
jgi:aerobic-type carbon monoxide dehydrogenase small subunit (CoxS/CutS family)